MQWTPSEISTGRIASIKAYRAEAKLPNLNVPLHLDACTVGWADPTKHYDLIVTINLLHLVSEQGVKTLIAEAARMLGNGGLLLLYGPFLRNGQTTSEGDARFHAELQTANPEIGYKDRDIVQSWGEEAGLSVTECIDMPANNLALIFKAV